MSLHTGPNANSGTVADVVDIFVAREHWRPIVTQALLHAAVLIALTFLLGLSPLQALAIIHVVASTSGLLSGLVALRMEQVGQDAGAVVIGRRAMAALLVAGAALLLAPLAG